ncbi:MAG: ADP-ribosylglycohydrolase family protein [Anaerolineales bacterium]|nr:ADP-ribosylglycohydrolase family protein [Anaerolineales bacterium]
MMDQEKFLAEHILGGIFGQALGDAFAMPAYLRPQDTLKYYSGWIETFLPGPPGHPAHDGLKAGQITDDTEQAMALASSIIEEGGITVEGAARAIVSWYDFIDGDVNPYVGPSTRRACQALKQGADPHTTGVNGDTDGGAMRISPIGLINPGRIDDAIRDAVTACTPTHFTQVAISGAAAAAAAIAAALTPGSSLDSVLEAGVYGGEQGAESGRIWLGASVPRRIELAVEIARRAVPVYDRIVTLFELIGSTLATSETVPTAFGILALAEGDPVQCARYSAAVSGDADTVGAIACAIAGTWKGVKAIPQDWIHTLETVNSRYDFRGTAKGLVKIAVERSI